MPEQLNFWVWLLVFLAGAGGSLLIKLVTTLYNQIKHGGANEVSLETVLNEKVKTLIENLHGEINRQSRRIESLEQKLSELEDENKELRKEVRDLREENDTLKELVDTKQTRAGISDLTRGRG